jgi:thiosulfate reductase cytochrome b subunit
VSASRETARGRWFKLLWIVPVIAAIAVLCVLLARFARTQPSVQSFMTTYPGQSALPAWAPVGFPAWVQWQHFLSAFFLLFIIRTGLLIRATKRPAAYWTRHNNGRIRTKGTPVRISLSHWLHLSLNILFVLNGAVFYVLLFATGQWVRVVPISWDIFPNAASTAIQYLSLNWPTDDGWVNYNALQVLAYFVTIFVAAPLALITGIRLVPGLSARWAKLDKVYPIGLARALHLPVMIYFLAFTVVHVTLVLSTGALRNLNHMYAGRDDQTWWGASIFIGSLILIAIAWIAMRPSIVTTMASLTGSVRR